MGQRAEAEATLARFAPKESGAAIDIRAALARVRGTLRLAAGDLAGARSELEKARKLLEGTGAWGERIRTWKALAELDLRCGNGRQAEMAWAQMNAARKRIGIVEKPLSALKEPPK